MDIELNAGFEKLIKDRDGEVKMTFQIPLSDEAKAYLIPHHTPLKIKVNWDEAATDTGNTQDKGCSDL